MQQEESKLLKLTVVLLAFMLLAMGCTQKSQNLTGDHSVVTGTDPNTPALPTKETPTTTEPVVREDPSTPDMVKEEQKLVAIMEDGTYVEDVSYHSPGGTEHVEFTITVQDDVVETAHLTYVSGSPTAKMFAGKIDKELQTLMAGKKLDQISLPKRISGSSLTSAAVAKQFEQWKA